MKSSVPHDQPKSLPTAARSKRHELLDYELRKKTGASRLHFTAVLPQAMGRAAGFKTEDGGFG